MNIKFKAVLFHYNVHFLRLLRYIHSHGRAAAATRCYKNAQAGTGFFFLGYFLKFLCRRVFNIQSESFLLQDLDLILERRQSERRAEPS